MQGCRSRASPLPNPAPLASMTSLVLSHPNLIQGTKHLGQRRAYPEPHHFPSPPPGDTRHCRIRSASSVRGNFYFVPISVSSSEFGSSNMRHMSKVVTPTLPYASYAYSMCTMLCRGKTSSIEAEIRDIASGGVTSSVVRPGTTRAEQAFCITAELKLETAMLYHRASNEGIQCTYICPPSANCTS
ncbi:hypothetical protein CONLIGDRAFT_151180 [Coniochaeta ligniaria NRRL 30616]|uniref:Uncharacterized protein n=1 Tax=Coniochaeta ligniaria NRRL 30616 TaxID=1408157 RepID=A0A1J7I5Q3_9PEZI|nr:hypothetical protein CONLIGDRAFT_151180 [Coniochaeta ligniaria NRRL 30616]